MSTLDDQRTLFDAIDVNNNGALIRGELIVGLRNAAAAGVDTSALGFASIDDAIAFFKAADADQSATITFDEFAAELAQRQAGAEE